MRGRCYVAVSHRWVGWCVLRPCYMRRSWTWSYHTDVFCVCPYVCTCVRASFYSSQWLVASFAAGIQWYNFWWARASYLHMCETPIISRYRHYYEEFLGTHCNATKQLSQSDGFGAVSRCGNPGLVRFKTPPSTVKCTISGAQDCRGAALRFMTKGSALKRSTFPEVTSVPWYTPVAVN
jgi:hypothetical protein